MRRVALSLFTLVFFLGGCNIITPTENDASVAPSQTAKVEDSKDSNGGMKKKILLLKFFNRSRHGGVDLSANATTMTRDALLSSNEFVILPQEEVEGYENFINEFGDYNFPLIFQKARLHNVSGVVTGSIIDIAIRESGDEMGLFRSRQYSVTATLKLNLYDATTERELMSRLTSADVIEEHTDFFKDREIASGYDTERGKVAVNKALDKVLPTLPTYAKKLAWTGRIAKVEMHRYYINAGELTGIRHGQLLRIFDQGQSIYDPETSALIGVAPGHFKGLLKVIDNFGDDGSIAVVHSGGGFREKDRVELYTPTVQN